MATDTQTTADAPRTYKVTHDGQHQNLTAEQVLAAAGGKKDDGNESFKRAAFTGQNEDYRWAARRYTEGVRLLNDMMGVSALHGGKVDRWDREVKGHTRDSCADEPSLSSPAVSPPAPEDDDDDIIELGSDGTFDAVAHDREAIPTSCEILAVPLPSGKGEEDWKPRARELQITLLLNRAAAHLKTVGHGGNDSAEKDCDVVLEMEPANPKALFRRGQARTGLHKFVGAQVCLGPM